MSLIDALGHAELSEPPHRRSELQFLNRSSLPIVSKTCLVFEAAFAHFIGNKAHIRGCFRSPINQAHFGGLFELLLHEMLRHRRLSPRRCMLTNAVTPDFMFYLPGGGTAIVEATMLQDRQNSHAAEVVNFLKAVEHRSLALEIEIDRKQSNNRTIRKSLSSEEGSELTERMEGRYLDAAESK